MGITAWFQQFDWDNLPEDFKELKDDRPPEREFQVELYSNYDDGVIDTPYTPVPKGSDIYTGPYVDTSSQDDNKWARFRIDQTFISKYVITYKDIPDSTPVTLQLTWNQDHDGFDNDTYVGVSASNAGGSGDGITIRAPRPVYYFAGQYTLGANREKLHFIIQYVYKVDGLTKDKSGNDCPYLMKVFLNTSKSMVAHFSNDVSPVHELSF